MPEKLPPTSAPRWTAVATYRSESGPVDVTYEFKDLFELHTLIARGPDQRALRDIRVTVLLGDEEDPVFLDCEASGPGAGLGFRREDDDHG